MSRPIRRASTRTAGALLAVLALLVGSAAPVEAQYFGRNKVQYDDFDFRVLTTDHFDIHYYPEEREAIEDVARMSERWYERFARTFQHEFESRKPLIIYADHPDFQQTNTLQGSIGEGTGGVTESLKNRVIMPLTGSYWDTDHVLGHELVHAFQYNIAQSRRGGGLRGLGSLPLWLIEGMAEYMSVGREDPLTAMWLRDALLRDDFPTIQEMTEEQRFFPYRFGQAFWAYVGGTYGDDAITQVFRRALRVGFQPAIEQVLGVSTDTLSVEWRRAVEQQYVPLMTGRAAPDSVGDVLISEEDEGGRTNVSPSLSPDGRRLAFLSERSLFSIDLYLADAQTGEIIRKLVSADSDPHVDALRYVESSGTWSPDGEYFAFVVFAEGDNEIRIVETSDGDEYRTRAFEGIGALNHPEWSPDGRYMAFTGIVGGISDLFVWDLETDEVRQLTDDKHGDFHPEWSPDGRTIAFSSDRGPETDFEILDYSEYQLALFDVASGEVEVLDIFDNARHSNPQYSPDGRMLYFISDQDGFSDIYRIDLANRAVERVTRVATGVSGISHMSPALTVADDTGEMAFIVFDEYGFQINRLPAAPPADVVAESAVDVDARGRRLPPAFPDAYARVSDYLDDPLLGLPEDGTFETEDAQDYTPELALDFIGQPSVGLGADRFGNYIGGGASAYFSDMLGNRQLGVALQAQGTLKDIGGQVQYADLSDRWNWGVSAGRIPYQLLFSGFIEDQGETYFAQQRQRIYVSSASGSVAYPFSMTRRVELSAGAVRYAYDIEQDRYLLDEFGRIIDFERVDLDEQEPDPLNLAQLGAAWVGDNAFFGFTSPVRGGRFRYELQQTVGGETFTTAIADWRRYVQPTRNLTFAMRGLHYGRYGDLDIEEMENPNDFVRTGLLQPLFLGYETFVRGYAWESFNFEEECLGQGSVRQNCPVYERLFGQRLAVVNAEFRVPLLGVEQYGLVNFPYLPTELIAFADGGLAWDSDEAPTLEFATDTDERVPVFSAGVGARFNILGFMVLEAYYAYPFQRPDRGAHWGFQVAPGW